MRSYFFRFILTIIYCVAGLLIAMPLSYFFQSDLFSQMSLLDYLRGGKLLLFETASFGAWDVYKRTLIGSVIGCLLIGRLIECFLDKKINKANRTIS